MQNRINNDEIFSKAEKIRDLLEKALPQSQEIAAPKIDEARRIRDELESMGFVVSWKATLNPQTLVCEVEVKLTRPKENMSPEEAKLYDAWLMKRWKVKFQEKKEGGK